MKIHIFLFSLFILSVLLNYMYFTFNKTAIQIVDEMGIGYNLGKTFNCCSSVGEESIFYEQIKTWGTVLPTKKMINKIKKYGFKTIRFQVYYTNLTNIINSEWLLRIKEIVDWIVKNGMFCILCVNHDKEFWISQNSKNKYINFWKQVANQFIDNDAYLIFETLTDIDIDIQHLFFSNFTQDFIDTIRNSDGYNKERLLIIPEMATEYEINNFYELDIPKDPSNKTAVSLHYYFPSETQYYYETLPITWIDKTGFLYEALPTTAWGSDYDYQDIINKMQILKSTFIDKGIPVILGEVGILSDYNNNITSKREFLLTLFSVTKEYNGIMACLWDNYEKISENNNYYNRETDTWNDEIIRKNILKMSKDNIIKSSDYYITTNLEVLTANLNFFYTNISNKKLLKIYINVIFHGILGTDFKIVIDSINKENEWIEREVIKKEGKKQYDGTTFFIIDVSNEDFNYDVFVMTEEGEIEDNNKYIIINNVTFEFEEYFPYLDYNSYRNSILNDIY